VRRGSTSNSRVYRNPTQPYIYPSTKFLLADELLPSEVKLEPREASKKVDNLAQIIVAVSAGLSLLIPMILFTLIKYIRYRLILVSGCVIMFAVAMGLSMPMEGKDLISATAGYTAILAVYLAVAGT
jgi:hypothetical protein